MVQSLNTKAIWTLASVIRHPSLLVPTLSVSNVSDINFEALLQMGIQAIIFDKDHTLTLPYATALHPSVQSGMEQCRSVFGRDKMAILSNSAGTNDDPDYADAMAVEDALQLNVIRHQEKKPGGLQEVLDHFQMDDASKLCMVGDRVLTDVVFGNLYGMLTIHVLPFDEPNRDNVMARIIRPVENTVLYSRLGAKYLPKSTHALWDGTVPLTLQQQQQQDNAPSTQQQDENISASKE